MSHRALLRSVLLGVCLASAWQTVACGGRVRTYVEVDDDGNPIAGASAGGASSAGRGGGSSPAGATTGAGAPSSAGAPAAGAGGACACSPPICGPGMHPMLTPANCCPVCVYDDFACKDAQAAYATLKSALLEKYSYGCMQDSDCVAVTTDNRCESCSNAAVWTAVADSYRANLSGFAQMSCSSCDAPIDFPCAPPTDVACVQGRCGFTSLK